LKLVLAALMMERKVHHLANNKSEGLIVLVVFGYIPSIGCLVRAGQSAGGPRLNTRAIITVAIDAVMK